MTWTILICKYQVNLSNYMVKILVENHRPEDTAHTPLKVGGREGGKGGVEGAEGNFT